MCGSDKKTSKLDSSYLSTPSPIPLAIPIQRYSVVDHVMGKNKNAAQPSFAMNNELKISKKWATMA